MSGPGTGGPGTGGPGTGGPGTGDRLVAVECPGCGASVAIEPGRRGAEQFCPTCDYPLFWVSLPREAVAEDPAAGEITLRRRPGASGIRMPATIPCPACRELNTMAAVHCVRCGSPMRPEPEPEPDPVPVPEPVSPPPVPEPVPAGWPWDIVAPLLVALGVAVLVGLVWFVAR